MKNKNWDWAFGCETTFLEQIELLPRFTIRYGGDSPRVIAFEWLWLSLFIVGINTPIGKH